MNETTQVFGQYLLHQKIKEDAISQTYFATADNPSFALRKFSQEVSEQERFVSLVLNAVAALAATPETFLLRFHDWGVVDGYLFVVEELPAGQPLSTLLEGARASAQSVPVVVALSIAEQLTSALATLHTQQTWRQGFAGLHGSLAPSNVLVCPDGTVKLLDCGIALFYELLQEKNPSLSNQMAPYFSPEQVKGMPFSEASDLYALGVILWELLQGAPLRSGNNMISLFMQIMTAPPPTFGPEFMQHEPSLARPLGELLGLLLQQAPEDRALNPFALLSQIQMMIAQLGVGDEHAQIKSWLNSLQELAPVQTQLGRHFLEEPIIERIRPRPPSESVPFVRDTVPDGFFYSEPSNAQGKMGEFFLAGAAFLSTRAGDVDKGLMVLQLVELLLGADSQTRHRAIWLLAELGPGLSELPGAFLQKVQEPRTFLKDYLRSILGGLPRSSSDFATLETLLSGFGEEECEVVAFCLLRLMLVGRSAGSHRPCSFLSREVNHVKARLYARTEQISEDEMPDEKTLREWIQQESARSLTEIQQRDAARHRLGFASYAALIAGVKGERGPTPIEPTSEREVVLVPDSELVSELVPVLEQEVDGIFAPPFLGGPESFEVPTVEPIEQKREFPLPASVPMEQGEEEESSLDYAPEKPDMGRDLEITPQIDEKELKEWSRSELSETSDKESFDEWADDDFDGDFSFGGDAPDEVVSEDGFFEGEKEFARRDEDAPVDIDESRLMRKKKAKKSDLSKSVSTWKETKDATLSPPERSRRRAVEEKKKEAEPEPKLDDRREGAEERAAPPAPKPGPVSRGAAAPPSASRPMPPASSASEAAPPPPLSAPASAQPPSAPVPPPAMGGRPAQPSVPPPSVQPPAMGGMPAPPSAPPSGVAAPLPGGAPPAPPVPSSSVSASAPPPPAPPMPKSAAAPAPVPMVSAPEPSEKIEETPLSDSLRLGASLPQPSADVEEAQAEIRPGRASFGARAPIEESGESLDSSITTGQFAGFEPPSEEPSLLEGSLDRAASHVPEPILYPPTQSAGGPSAQAPEMMPARKSAGGLISGCLKVVGGIILSPIIIPVFAVVGVVWGAYKIVGGFFKGIGKIFRWGFSGVEARAKAKGVPTFEMFLSEEAGKPGVVERVFAHSLLLKRGMQATFGVRFVLCVHAFDTLVGLVVSYIGGIYQSWKMMKTIARKIKREIDQSQAESVAKDLAECRIRIARIFAFSGFYAEELRLRFAEHEVWSEIAKPSFPLHEILHIRGHLDDMERDLNFLTLAQTTAFLKGSVWKFLGSLIPNPIQFLTAWKDIFVMIFYMRYPRRDIEGMMASLLVYYRKTSALLEENVRAVSGKSPAPMDDFLCTWLEHEETLVQRVPSSAIDAIQTLPEAVERNRQNIQRLMRVLCHPLNFTEPTRWARFDLLLESMKNEDFGRFQPKISVEFEDWLTQQVARCMRENGIKVDKAERALRLKEALDLHRRHKFLRKLDKQHTLF